MAPSSSSSSSPHSKPKHKPLTATTTTTTISPSQNTTNKDTNATLSANFAHPATSPPCQQQQQQQQQQHHPPTTVDYDHEIYLQLVADGHKTPNQVYREERARHRTSRALDPAIISDPRGVPSSIDFEWAEESQRQSQTQRQRLGDVSSI